MARVPCHWVVGPLLTRAILSQILSIQNPGIKGNAVSGFSRSSGNRDSSFFLLAFFMHCFCIPYKISCLILSESGVETKHDRHENPSIFNYFRSNS